MSDEPLFQYLIILCFVAGSQQEIIIPADLPLVQELGATLREWAQIWHKLYVVRVRRLALSHLPLRLQHTQQFDAFCC